MRVLVTGGSGQLGQALKAYVEQDEFSLTLFDLVDDGSAQVVRGDIGDQDLVRDVVRGHDAVVHAAALHGKHVRDHGSQMFLRVNVQGTASVIDACVAAGVSHLVLMSSTSVYGLSASLATRQTVWVDETTPCQPGDLNDLCKVLCEQLGSYAARRHGLPVTILRSGRFFVGDRLDFNLRKLSGAVDELDVAQAVVRALRARPDRLHTYCVASTTRFTRADLPRLSEEAHRLIEERYPGATAAFASVDRELPFWLHRVVDISRIRDSIGYHPHENFDTFVRRLCRDRALALGGPSRAAR
jgi:nucleoside-diphosphate-sugar epimerase